MNTHRHQADATSDPLRTARGSSDEPLRPNLSASLAAEDVAELAHELRTPLAAIYSFAELMAEARFGPVGNARYETYVAGIRDQARHLLDVIEAMLAPADQAEGIVLGDIDPGLIASEVFHALGPMAAEAGVTLLLALDPQVRAVPADRTAVTQMLFNLASNAIRHSGPGARTIIRTGLETGGRCWLEVGDDGPGLPPIPRVETGDPAGPACEAWLGTQPGHQRRGLGLPLTRKLAHRNNVELTFDQVIPHGTRARLTFGLARQALIAAQ